MATVHKRASAKRDLIEHYVYLGEHADFETAERFLANADASFTDLSRNPGMGAPRSLRSPKLAGLHKWRVSGFEKFLIFYLPARTAFQSCASCMPRRTGGPFLEFYEHRTDPLPTLCPQLRSNASLEREPQQPTD